MNQTTESGMLPQPLAERRRKKILVFALKASLVAALLFFLAKKGFISLQDTKQAFTRWEIIPGAGGLLLTAILGVVRWQWLLQGQGITLPWTRTLELTFVGNFFNIALPGAVSGDLIKALYIGREVPGLRARAFGSILFDRVAGVSALAIVSAGALLIGFAGFKGTAILSALRVLVTAAAAGAISFYCYLFLVREHHDPLLRVLKKFEQVTPKLGSVTRIYLGLRHYHHCRWIVFKVLALSVLIHLIVGYSCFMFAKALGDQNIALLSIYVVVPLGLLVTAVPVMPAGVGTGHAAFLYLFHLMGSQRGADVFTLTALVNLSVGAIGGLVYLRFRAREPQATVEIGTN